MVLLIKSQLSDHYSVDYLGKGTVFWFQSLFRLCLPYSLHIFRHLGWVYHFNLLICYPCSLSSIDITEDKFAVEAGIPFNPSKLNYENPDNEKMRQPVLKVLKKVVDLSNANIIKNADRLLSKGSVENDIEWVEETSKRVPENRYKLSYWILFLVFAVN